MLSDSEPLTLIYACCAGRCQTVPFSEFKSLPIGSTITCERHGPVTFEPVEYLLMMGQQSGPYELVLRLAT
jgi:hypothetical protein